VHKNIYSLNNTSAFAVFFIRHS